MKIALGIEYDGSQYSGWQRQRHVSSIQSVLEAVLSRIANHPVTLFCAGRTDAGVHATGQVVHFETDSKREDTAWTLGMNAQLPPSITVRWMVPVDSTFHARFSALARRYRYIIYNHHLRPAILGRGLLHFPFPLDEKKMHRAAQYLLGENDFSAFRAAHCQSKTPWREIQKIKVQRIDRYVVVDVQANAFVHHMVRNIVGSLLEVGSEQQNEAWIHRLLIGRDRTLAAPTAKPHGLYLVDVVYPSVYSLPKLPLGPLYLNLD